MGNQFDVGKGIHGEVGEGGLGFLKFDIEEEELGIGIRRVVFREGFREEGKL